MSLNLSSLFSQNADFASPFLAVEVSWTTPLKSDKTKKEVIIAFATSDQKVCYAFPARTITARKYSTIPIPISHANLMLKFGLPTMQKNSKTRSNLLNLKQDYFFALITRARSVVTFGEGI